MTKNDLIEEYFDWIYSTATSGIDIRPSYTKLFRKLFSTPFNYILAMDGNRYDDGIDLRYRFGYERGYSEMLIANYLDDRPCSVLEMMFALALRCEEHIMANPEIGNRVSIWFWDMIKSLGADAYWNSKYSEKDVNYILERFLNRQYDKNGRGGLFTINKKRYDMRTTEIWEQAMWYLNEKTEE